MLPDASPNTRYKSFTGAPRNDETRQSVGRSALFDDSLCLFRKKADGMFGLYLLALADAKTSCDEQQPKTDHGRILVSVGKSYMRGGRTNETVH